MRVMPIPLGWLHGLNSGASCRVLDSWQGSAVVLVFPASGSRADEYSAEEPSRAPVPGGLDLAAVSVRRLPTVAHDEILSRATGVARQRQIVVRHTYSLGAGNGTD